MILSQKTDCIDSMAAILDKTSAWRRTVSAKFEDPRNSKAADTLERLANESANLTDEQWDDLKNYFSWASPTWRDAVFQAARQVGFGHRQRSLDSFVRLLARQLVPTSVAA